MSKYGSGLTFGQVCNLEKAEIKQALAGKVIDYYDDNENPVYRDGTKEETDRVILKAYDAAVFHALDSMISGRAYSRLMGELSDGVNDFADNFMRYIELREEEEQKYFDYVYEGEEDDD